ncbi:MAG: DNA polymerase III subunit delta [Eubacteriales bacterium]|nr:DNA polymerase III subunit delta [Eubacteriales bacterium]
MKTIREDIKNQTFKQVYLLYGTEAYLREDYKKKLLKALMPEEDSMNMTVYSGAAVDEAEVIGQAETMPFFADRRVILLEDTGFFKKSCDKLADYMKKLPDYLVIVFVEEAIDKRNKLWKAVQKNGYAAEFAEQSEAILSRWVLQQITKEGKKITGADMQHFLEITGNDMSNISSELEKLLSYCMDADIITRADIDAVAAPQITGQIFEMVRAVAEHRQREALDFYYDLLALKEPPMRILFLLARQFNQLLTIKTMQANGKGVNEIASACKLPPFVVKKSQALCRQYSTKQLQRIVGDMVQAETDVKTGRLSDALSVELMIVRCSA